MINLIISNRQELYLKDSSTFAHISSSTFNSMLNVGNFSSRKIELIRDENSYNIIDSIDLIDIYLKKYVGLLASKLAQHHGINNFNFWEKCISLYLINLICNCHYFLRTFDTVFKPSEHSLRIAKIPPNPPMMGIDGIIDYEYWSISDEGREYFAGEYLRLFYPGLCEEVELIHHSPFELQLCNQDTPPKILHPKKWLLDLRSRLNDHGIQKSSRILLLNLNTDENYIRDIQKEFKSDINFIFQPSILNYSDKKSTSRNADFRSLLFDNLINNPDKLDIYILKCLKSSFPWTLLEGFKSTLFKFNRYWGKFSKLDAVVTEFSYQESALFISALELLNIKTVTISHFFPLEILYSLKLRSSLNSKFQQISRGKYTNTPSTTVGSGTIYPYEVTPKERHHSIDFLYIATDFYPFFLPKDLSTNLTGIETKSCFQIFTLNILENLPPILLRKISIKLRPLHLCGPENLAYPSDMPRLDRSIPAKNYMSKARFIVIEGLSTSFFEALASDIPVICFWPENLYFFQSEYLDYFKKLEDVGMILHDPCKVVNLLTKNEKDIITWWQDSNTKTARQEFLSMHLDFLGDFKKTLSTLLKSPS